MLPIQPDARTLAGSADRARGVGSVGVRLAEIRAGNRVLLRVQNGARLVDVEAAGVHHARVPAVVAESPCVRLIHAASASAAAAAAKRRSTEAAAPATDR